MPSNYQESQVSGTTWRRARRVVIDNPFQGQPQVIFAEEKIAMLDGEVIKSALGTLTLDFDPEKTIDLLNPQTGEPVGASMNYGEIYAIIFSAYMAAANERDNPPQAIIPNPFPME